MRIPRLGSTDSRVILVTRDSLESRERLSMYLRDGQSVLSSPTDTAVPITPVPIFYLHEGEHPICATSGCICHAHEEQIRHLLLGVIIGETKLRKFYNGVIVGKEVI